MPNKNDFTVAWPDQWVTTLHIFGWGLMCRSFKGPYYGSSLRQILENWIKYYNIKCWVQQNVSSWKKSQFLLWINPPAPRSLCSQQYLSRQAPLPPWAAPTGFRSSAAATCSSPSEPPAGSRSGCCVMTRSVTQNHALPFKDPTSKCLDLWHSLLLYTIIISHSKEPTFWCHDCFMIRNHVYVKLRTYFTSIYVKLRTYFT